MKVKIRNLIYRTIFYQTKAEAIVNKKPEIAKLEKEDNVIISADVTEELVNFSWRLDIGYVKKGDWETVDDSVEEGVYIK